MEIKSKSLVGNLVTVTIERAGLKPVDVTRPVPDCCLASQEAFDNYMGAYITGLMIEFPEAPVVSVTPVKINFGIGEVLNTPEDVQPIVNPMLKPMVTDVPVGPMDVPMEPMDVPSQPNLPL